MTTITITLDTARRIRDAQYMAIRNLSCSTAESAHARSCLCDAHTAIEAAINDALRAPAPQGGGITKGQVITILEMALDLERTGRMVSLPYVQERSDYVARNRNIRCALEDYLHNLTGETQG